MDSEICATELHFCILYIMMDMDAERYKEYTYSIFALSLTLPFPSHFIIFSYFDDCSDMAVCFTIIQSFKGGREGKKEWFVLKIDYSAREMEEMTVRNTY